VEVEKFNAFVSRFPDFVALHKAQQDEVLRFWKGLGYNRRALALKRIAAQFASPDSFFPHNPAEIDLLPSIGAATASSIAVFAFNTPHVFIETNIRRVFIHFFFANKRRQVHDKELMPLIEAALDTKKPRDWYYALMDYGAMLGKTMPNPNRKSAHYAKQSPFAGSNRQIRGAVLDILLKCESKKISLRNLHVKLAQFPNYEERVGGVLAALQKEGFLVLKGKMVHIKD
jgi:A/G-specific adenine glycosylase